MCSFLSKRLILPDGGYQDVRLKDGKFPEVFLNGIWSPICGHWFWDTDFGANLFCQRLTSDPASTGQVIRRWDKRLEKDAIRIGNCLSNDQWLSCSGGCNDLGTGKRCNNIDTCGAKQPASIEIKCSQGKAGMMLSKELCIWLVWYVRILIRKYFRAFNNHSFIKRLWYSWIFCQDGISIFQ